MVKAKTIEETYQKLSQREHVLRRSGVYIGDIKKNTEELWVLNDNKMVKQFVEYSPGFMKIFDEVLSNATDHAIRDSNVNKIEVNYCKETGEISVYNNGAGVPVVLHKEQNMYVPELIFGHLLSGSNYDDNDTRTTVGVNGMGIKLTNIFSKKFVVETVDSENKKKFIQEFSNNMSDKTKPKVTSAANTKSYTKITFIPDYTRFSMENLEDDTILLIKKRVYDCIANTKSHVNLYLNGEKIKGKSFTDYIKYYFDDSKIISEQNIQTIKGTEFIWEYAIVPSEHYEQVSFVNGNCTHLGGKHVDYILYQIINKIKDLLETKKKLKDVKPNFIKDKFCLFLKATIINPSFNSQTKETLTTQVKDFGCKVEVTESFINKIYKSSIIDEIVEFCKLKESSNLAKSSDGKKVSKVYIPKLEDAIDAGTAKSEQCTLILTEGDSAKTFAMWGRAIIGPEKYGVFSLKGKLLNVRDATMSQLINNEEINNIKQILGLKEKKVYTNTKELRYGRIMLLTDSDVDGSHIKSLVVNFIHSGWESLLKIKPNFIQTFKTPIVKAIKGNDTKEFFTEQDYHLWLQGNNTKNYKINYYKGLGTSTKDDAKKLFKRFDELIVNYYHKDDKCDESILLAFDKDKNNKVKIKDTDTDISDIVQVKCTDQRKAWLANYDKDSYIDVKENVVSYQDLINKELIHFSIYDNSRSIPSICDGLKPSQRKILYYMLNNNINVSMKVAQLTGKISSDTSYHHGEASLEGAIVGLAQDFVGTNNINLLYPDGNHGCLDPNTEILMWNGTKKIAKEIKIGDKLVGDDGESRVILQTITGKDDMYEIKIENEKFIVNSQHKLTLVYSSHLKIFWRESDKSWRVTYFDPKHMKGVSKNIRTNLSSNKLETYNKSCLNKDEAYKQIVDFVKNLNINKHGIFDIKVCDYLKLNQTDKHHFKSVKNSKCINWVNKTLDINPYLLGSWLGDGNSNGNGITSIDSEIIKKWVIEMNKIDCEITHDKVKETHDNYHYSVRNSGNGIKNAVGSTMKCDGCEYKISEVCKWNSGIIYPTQTKKQPQQTGQHNWKKILKKNNLLDNKHIPFDYIYTSKENRLELLAGFVDTDGYVNYQNNVPRILIGQSKRLRSELIYDLKFLCETLGFNCKIYHEQKNRKTKKNEDASLLVLCITGDNLQEIPCLLTRKKIQPYTFKINMYISNFTITSLGVGDYCGWEIDGNNRFLLGNFFITHNSRLRGGKDAASARYIKTRLSDITPLIFNKLDFGLLKLLQDDGIQIEPEWYLPIIPMVLVNGCDGIGTGYSTSIPPYNPKNLINNILRVMDDKEPLPLIPYYRNFNGELIKDSSKENTFITKGKWEKLSDTQIKVTELPVGCWVTVYKEFLESLVVETKKDSKTKKRFALKSVDNRTTDENDAIDFLIEFKNAEDLDLLIKSNTLEKELKLTKSVNTNNMHVFSETLILTKYTNPNDILLDWYDQRLEYYQKRKDYLIKKYKDELIILKAKIRFVNGYINKDFDINRKSKVFIINLLKDRMYPDQEGSYDYLLNLPVYSFTEERIEALNKQVKNKQAELDYITNKTDKDLWRLDLEELKKYL